MAGVARTVSRLGCRGTAVVIVVLLGTGPDSFDRLMRPLDQLAGRHAWDVFVQLGHTAYTPQHCRYERFLERDRLMKIIESSELVVCQGGYGSIRDSVVLGKPVVAVPRQPSLGESPDNQEEMVRAMEKIGLLIGVYDVETQLESAILRASTFRPSKRPKNRIPGLIREFIEGAMERGGGKV